MKHFNPPCDYHELARIYGTPLYLYDLDYMDSQYNLIKSSFKGFKSLICYALKANSNLSLLKSIANLGSGADCVSLNEIKKALLAGIPNYKIIFSGVGKEDYELEEALRLGILFINVESEMELMRLEKLVADSKGAPARISLRVNPEVEAKTHPYISTGLRDSKFGLDIQTSKRLYLYAHKSAHLNPIAIHHHIGSQILDKAPLLDAANKILDLARGLLSAGLEIKFFDLGGGFGISYGEEDPLDIAGYLSGIIRKIDSLDLTAICEPGRSIVGNAGALLSRVIGEKLTDSKNFLIVDSAMTELLRPSLYEAYHHISKVWGSKSSSYRIYDVVGAVCESGDYLAKARRLPVCESGDLILIESSGAYGYSMASNYNSRLRPAEVGLRGGKHFLIRDREDFESSLKNEIKYLDRY